MPLVLVSLMPPEVNSLKHPRVAKFKRIIKSGCADYDCKLTHFAIKDGTVLIGVTSHELAKDIRYGVELFGGRLAEIVENEAEFLTQAKQFKGKRRPSLKTLLGSIASRYFASFTLATLEFPRSFFLGPESTDPKR